MTMGRTFEKFLLDYLTAYFSEENVSIFDEGAIWVIKYSPGERSNAPYDLLKPQFFIGVTKREKQKADELSLMVEEAMKELGNTSGNDILPPSFVTGSVQIQADFEFSYRSIWEIPHYYHTPEEGW